jgi:hypothetical protein
MKKKPDYEKNCAHCEYGTEIFQGDFCVCEKKGVTAPSDCCSRFIFDPLKVKVSVRKLPAFHPVPPSSETK